MKKIIGIFFLLLTVHIAFSQDIVWVKKNGLWGIMNSKGKYILEPQFEGYSTIFNAPQQYKVYANGRWGLVSEKGKIILPPTYEDIKWHPHLKHFAKIIKGGTTYQEYNNERRKFLVGIIDKNGKEILPPIYDVIQYYANHFRVGIDVPNVREGSYSSGGSWGLFDEQGNEVKEINHEYCNPDEHVILAKKDGYKKFYGYKKNQQILETSYASTSYLYDDLFLVEQNSKFGIIDIHKKEKVPIIYERILKRDVKDGFVSFLKNDLWGVYKIGEGEIIPPKYKEPLINYGDGMFQMNSITFLDATTQQEIKHQYHRVFYFHEGYATARKNVPQRNNTYLINKKGEIQGEHSFLLGYFENGYWFLRLDEMYWIAFNTKTQKFTNKYKDFRNYSSSTKPFKYGFLKRKNIWVIQNNVIAFDAETTPQFNDYGIKLIQDNYQAFYSFSGNLILNDTFHFIHPIDDKRIMAQPKNSEYTFIYDYKGNRLKSLNIKPSFIYPFNNGKALVVFEKEEKDIFGSRKKTYSYIDTEGNLLVPIAEQIKDAMSFKNGITAITRDNISWILLNDRMDIISLESFESVGISK